VKRVPLVRLVYVVKLDPRAQQDQDRLDQQAQQALVSQDQRVQRDKLESLVSVGQQVQLVQLDLPVQRVLKVQLDRQAQLE
jgi:hypothetical protein